MWRESVERNATLWFSNNNCQSSANRARFSLATHSLTQCSHSAPVSALYVASSVCIFSRVANFPGDFALLLFAQQVITTHFHFHFLRRRNYILRVRVQVCCQLNSNLFAPQTKATRLLLFPSLFCVGVLSKPVKIYNVHF